MMLRYKLSKRSMRGAIEHANMAASSTPRIPTVDSISSNQSKRVWLGSISNISPEIPSSSSTYRSHYIGEDHEPDSIIDIEDNRDGDGDVKSVPAYTFMPIAEDQGGAASTPSRFQSLPATSLARADSHASVVSPQTVDSTLPEDETNQFLFQSTSAVAPPATPFGLTEEAASLLVFMKSSPPTEDEDSFATVSKNTKKRVNFPNADEDNESVLPPKKLRRRNKRFPRSPSTSHHAESTGATSNKAPRQLGIRKPFKSGLRLSVPEDSQELNSLHCFVRSELLEVFCINEDFRGRTSPRVGLRCSYCGHLPRNERSGASMSAFFPKSLGDIYRSTCTWQRIHFKACAHIPEDQVEKYHYLKETDRTRGTKAHWAKSAYQLGLRDIDSNRSGVVWAPSEDESPSETRISIDLTVD